MAEPDPGAPALGPPPGASKRMRFDATISLGNVLIVVGMLAGGVTAWNSGTRVDERRMVTLEQATTELASLRRNFEAQVEASRIASQAMLQASRENVRDAAAQLERNVEGQQQAIIENIRRVEAGLADLNGRAEGRRQTVDTRLDLLSNRVAQVAAEQAVLSRASNVSLPGAPGVRRQ